MSLYLKTFDIFTCNLCSRKVIVEEPDPLRDRCPPDGWIRVMNIVIPEAHVCGQCVDNIIEYRSHASPEGSANARS